MPEAVELVINATDRASGVLRGVGDALGAVGTLAAGVFAAGLGAATAAVMSGMQATQQWGDGIDKLGDTFGMSGEQASAWSFMLNRMGVPIEEGAQQLNYFTRSLNSMAEAMADPKAKPTPMAEALQKLGVNAFDAHGKLKTFDDLMPQIMDAFQKLPAGVNSTALAMDLFGARGGSKFLDLLRQGSAGLKDASDKAKEFGLTMSSDTADSIEQFGFAQNELNLGLLGLRNQIGVAVLPAFKNFVSFINANVLPSLGALAREYAPRITEALRNLSTWIQTVGIPALTQFKAWLDANIPPLVAAITSAWNNELKPVLDALQAWMKTDGIQAIQTFVAEMKSLAPMISEWKELMTDLKNFTSETFGTMNTDSASSFLNLSNVISGTFENLRRLIQGSLDIMRAIQSAWQAMVRGDWVTFADQIGVIFVTLWQNTLPGMIDRFAQWVGAQMASLAYNMLGGLVRGLYEQADAVRDALYDIIEQAINMIRSRLGIHSPSTVFAEMGAMMAQGLADGFGTPQLNFAGAISSAAQNGMTTSAPMMQAASQSSLGNIQIIFQLANAPTTQEEGNNAARLLVNGLRAQGVMV